MAIYNKVKSTSTQVKVNLVAKPSFFVPKPIMSPNLASKLVKIVVCYNCYKVCYVVKICNYPKKTRLWKKLFRIQTA